jgi:hypothetical protein
MVSIMKLAFGLGGQGGYARSIHHERCLTQAAIAEHTRFERKRHELFHGSDGSHITIRNLGGRPKVRCANCRDWASWQITGVGMKDEPDARGSYCVCADCREWARNLYRQGDADLIIEEEIGDLECFTCRKPIKDGDPYVAPIICG